MKEMTLSTFLAVFEEIFGRGLFWAMVVAAVIVTALYLFVLIRDRAVSWKKFLYAQISMPFGFVGAIWFVMAMTHSHLTDLGGPVDLIVFLMVGAGGAIGAAILVYTLESLVSPPKKPE